MLLTPTTCPAGGLRLRGLKQMGRIFFVGLFYQALLMADLAGITAWIGEVATPWEFDEVENES